MIRSIVALRSFVPLCILAAVLSLAPVPRVSAAPVNVDFFYTTLKDQGSWFTTDEYGDVWQPYIAYKNDSWRPYTDGYWTYTDGGWMFVSYESFGWAVYHYGRWTHLKDIGWAWVPGTEWAPAWVAWRSSDPNAPGAAPANPNIAATSTDAPPNAPGNPPAPPAAANDGANLASGVDAPPPGNGGPGDGYIGWAPLPPEAVYNDGYSYGPSVDVDFGIDPYDYCFTGIGFFGAPWIGGVLFGPGRSYYCCAHSFNVTNIYYNRSGAYRGVFAGGPNYDRLRGLTGRPIPQLRIDRTAGLGANTLSRVNGRTASVFAPRFSHAGVAPNGRVQFRGQHAFAHAAVLPGAQRGGGADAAAQTAARQSFAHQAQEFRQAHQGNVPGNAERGTMLATPNGVRPAEADRSAEERQAAHPEAATPRTESRTAGRSSSTRRSHASTGSRGRSYSHSGGHTTAHHSSGGHGGGGHGHGGGHAGGGHGGGKKR